jgi:glutamine phosphoribosylpyrophosphate amidotransferase
MKTVTDVHPLYKEFTFRKNAFAREGYLKNTVTIGSKFYSERFEKDRIVTRKSDSNIWLDGVRHSWKDFEKCIRKQELKFVWIA